ncbi:MAG: glycosyltransferase family 2 protein [Nitrospinales bacterium]
MKISVLIATRNRPQLLAECVSSLLRNTRQPEEIVLIDQSDPSSPLGGIPHFHSQRTKLRYEKMPPLGKSAAVNRALQISCGDFLAFADDDVQADETWLERFEALATQYPEVAMFCGRVLPEKNTSPDGYLNLALRREQKYIDCAAGPLNMDFCGCNMFIRRESILEVGGFCEYFGPGGRFRSAEDGELAYRLSRGGASILYSPEPVVYHSGWRREKDNERLKLDYAFGLGAFAGYYLKKGDRKPLLNFLTKFLLKFRRLILGALLWRKERVLDGYLHLKGFSLGFIRGSFAPKS